jgi:hypothetical protein
MENGEFKFELSINSLMKLTIPYVPAELVAAAGTFELYQFSRLFLATLIMVGSFGCWSLWFRMVE